MNDVYRGANEEIYCHRDHNGTVVGNTFVLGGGTQPYKLRGNVFTQYFDIFIPAGDDLSSVAWNTVVAYNFYTFVDTLHFLPLIKWGSTADTGTADSRVLAAFKKYLRWDTMYLIADEDITGLAPPVTNGVGTWQPFVMRNSGNANNGGGGKVWQAPASAGPALPKVDELSGYSPPPDFRYLKPNALGTKSNMFSLGISLLGGASVVTPGYIRAETSFTVFG